MACKKWFFGRSLLCIIAFLTVETLVMGKNDNLSNEEGASFDFLNLGKLMTSGSLGKFSISGSHEKIGRWYFSGLNGIITEHGLFFISSPQMTLSIQSENKDEYLQDASEKEKRGKKKEIVISSIECFYNPVSNTLSGEKTISIEADEYKISGQGYDIFCDKGMITDKGMIVTIRKNVKMSFPSLQKFGKDFMESSSSLKEIESSIRTNEEPVNKINKDKE